MTEITKAVDLTRKVALYRSPYDNLTLCEVYKGREGHILGDGYVRVSEILEVVLTPLPASEVVAGQLRQLYALRAQVAGDMAVKLADLDARIANLRALPEPDKNPRAHLCDCKCENGIHARHCPAHGVV